MVVICPVCCEYESYSEQHVRDHVVKCHGISRDTQRGIERKRKKGMWCHDAIGCSEGHRIYREFYVLYMGIQ